MQRKRVARYSPSFLSPISHWFAYTYPIGFAYNLRAKAVDHSRYEANNEDLQSLPILFRYVFWFFTSSFTHFYCITLPLSTHVSIRLTIEICVHTDPIKRTHSQLTRSLFSSRTLFAVSLLYTNNQTHTHTHIKHQGCKYPDRKIIFEIYASQKII